MKKIFVILLLNVASIFSQGYLCVIGGGSENYNDWSDAPYSWMVEKGDSGKVLVLFYDDKTDWLVNYFLHFGASEAVNIKIDNGVTANNQSIYDEIITADIIFLPGGDQYKYISRWKGTKTEEAIKYVYDNGGVIGGTSAGAMILGETDFSARSGTVYPDEALENPFNNYMKFEENFLNLQPGIIFDTHFVERGRFGRMAGFLFNLYSTGKEVTGVGIDDRTALCISPDGNATVAGSGSVWVMSKDESTKIDNQLPNGYSFKNIKMDLLVENWKINLNNFDITPPADAQTYEPNYEETSVTGNFALTGSEDITVFSENVLADYLNKTTVQNCVIIYNSGYEVFLNPVKEVLSGAGVSFTDVAIEQNNLDDDVLAGNIESSDLLIIAGNDNQKIKLLASGTEKVVLAVRMKLNNGVKILFGGETAPVVSALFIDNVSNNPNAANRGLFSKNAGLGQLSGIILQPAIFNNSNYFENRTAALFWGLYQDKANLGLFLDDSQIVDYQSETNNLRVKTDKMPVMLVDVSGCTFSDTARTPLLGSQKPRHAVAMTNLRLSLSNIDKDIDLNSGEITLLSENELNSPDVFSISDNYPNPFNPGTNFYINSAANSSTRITIFNITGEKLDEFSLPATFNGNYYLNLTGYAAGIYLVSFSNANQSIIKKIVCLK